MPIARLGSASIHYETAGTGEPLLLIMGFAMPGAAWIPALPFLGDFRSVYYDNRGTGTSECLEGSYSVAAMAGDAIGLLDALGLPSAYVYGISMGGMIAQQMALDHPARVRKLVLGCTWPGGAHALLPAPDAVEALINGVKLMSSDPDRALDTILPVLYPREFIALHPEIKALLMLAMAGIPPIHPEIAERILMAIRDFDVYERLPEIQCPTLVIHGDQDLLIPPGNALLLKERIPRAELWTLPGAGHNFMGLDIPGIVHRISQWLRS
jgi:3-oxoadipate enol-lactonase